jgi:hypothetical protein
MSEREVVDVVDGRVDFCFLVFFFKDFVVSLRFDWDRRPADGLDALVCDLFIVKSGG